MCKVEKKRKFWLGEFWGTIVLLLWFLFKKAKNRILFSAETGLVGGGNVVLIVRLTQMGHIGGSLSWNTLYTRVPVFFKSFFCIVAMRESICAIFLSKSCYPYDTLGKILSYFFAIYMFKEMKCHKSTHLSIFFNSL